MLLVNYDKGWIIHSELKTSIGLSENNLKMRLFTVDEQNVHY